MAFVMQNLDCHPYLGDKIRATKQPRCECATTTERYSVLHESAI